MVEPCGNKECTRSAVVVLSCGKMFCRDCADEWQRKDRTLLPDAQCECCHKAKATVTVLTGKNLCKKCSEGKDGR